MSEYRDIEKEGCVILNGGACEHQWISPIDRLPSNSPYESISCICFMKDGHDKNGCFNGFFRIATYTFNGFHSACENITDDVEYWMLRPPLPKENE